MTTTPDCRHRRWRTALVALLICCAPAGSIVLAQDEDALSVEEFVQMRAKWPVIVGTTWKVEGRYPGMSNDRMSFTNCELLFEFAEGVRPPTSRSKTVQVTGALQKRQGKLTFLVSRIKPLPSDADRLEDRRGRLPQDDAAPWYALADWAAGRGKFYEDDELVAAAAGLRRSGIEIEYRQTGIADIEPLKALAGKAESFGLPHGIRDEIVHDALRRELRAVSPKDARQLAVVVTHLLNELPGANVPVNRDDAALAVEKEYERQPLAVYQRADQDQRRMLHRLLYARAALQRIKLDAAENGSNGFAIAKRIEQTLPEFANPEFPDADEAERCRLREIDWQWQHLAELSRDELLTLSERLEQRKPASRAAEARRAWLAAQEPALRKGGASGLLDLAQEHIALLNDVDTAAEIYMELYRTPTGQQTARSRLVELGYRFDGTNWQRSPDAVPDATAEAIRLGIVRRGMTADQVRAALGGKPTSVVRFAVRDQISELWTYRDHGVVIELRRRGADADRIAAEISELAGP